MNQQGEERTNAPGLIVVVRVTNRCGLGCKYCGFSRSLRLPIREMDPDKLIRFGEVLGAWQAKSGRSVHVSWLGGEPYEWEKLFEVSSILSERDQLSLGVTTNGMGFTNPQNRSRTIALFDQVTVSIDGDDHHHNRVRPSKGGRKEIVDRLIQLRCESRMKKGWILRANVVLTRNNIETFRSHCLELARLGFDEITFNQLGGNDRPDFYAENHLLPHQVQKWVEEMPALRVQLEKLGVHLAGSDNYLQRIVASTLRQTISIGHCHPAEEFLFVDESGRVSPCSFTSSVYSVTLDQLNSTESIDALPAWFSKRRQEMRCRSCLDCHATHVYDKFVSLGLKQR